MKIGAQGRGKGVGGIDRPARSYCAFWLWMDFPLHFVDSGQDTATECRGCVFCSLVARFDFVCPALYRVRVVCGSGFPAAKGVHLAGLGEEGVIYHGPRDSGLTSMRKALCSGFMRRRIVPYLDAEGMYTYTVNYIK